MSKFFALSLLALSLTATADDQIFTFHTVVAPQKQDCRNDFCSSDSYYKKPRFDEWVTKLGLTKILTFEPANSGAKDQPIVYLYARIENLKTNTGVMNYTNGQLLRNDIKMIPNFKRFYVFMNWNDNKRDPKKYPTENDNDYEVVDTFTIEDLKGKSARTISKMDGTTVATAKFNSWLNDSETALVIDLRVLEEYNIAFSSDYSTRQLTLEIDQNAKPKVYFKNLERKNCDPYSSKSKFKNCVLSYTNDYKTKESSCNKDTYCKGVKFDHIMATLRGGTVAKYIGVDELTFWDYDKMAGDKGHVAWTDL